MTRTRPSLLVLLTAAAALAVVLPDDAAAIPAFARKYQISCSTCHAPIPRLKPFGEEFAARGFRMEDASKEPSRATYDVGDPLLTLARDLPLAVRLDAQASYKDDGESRTDFEWPWSLKVLSGGPITGKISYYFYAILERGESIKLEDTFLQFNEVLGLPVDLVLGQFQVSDPLFKRELRLERNDYSVFRTRVGVIPTNLTYDRGLVLTWHAPGEVEVIGQILNGNGIDAAVDDNFDDNELKNTALRVVRQFGPVRVGAFGYLGKESVTGGPSTTISYLGPDLMVQLAPKWQLNTIYLERRDEDPFLVGRRGSDLVTRGGFAELLFFPQGQDGRWAVAGLYNKVDSDVSESRAENVSLTATYLLARNLKATGEAFRDLESDASRASFGLVTAF
ncbi:MAG: hypothetical protein ABIL09_04745 [Gemmatimonadota bacterium]